MVALRDQPYIPLYVLDFLSDEKLRECSAESVGVYIMLMCVLHKQKKYGAISLSHKDVKSQDPISNFAVKLALHIPFDPETIERSLRELIDRDVIQLEGDRLWQKRMLKDGQISEARASAGKKGAAARYAPKEENDGESDFAMAKPMANDIANTMANAENTPEPEKTEEVPEKKPLIEERFDEFWKAYPRKSSKGSAKKAWKRIAPTQELFDKIMSALAAAKNCEQWKKERGQFIPYPATWLNQERWEDDYGVPAVDSGKKQPPADFNPDDPYANWGEEK